MLKLIYISFISLFQFYKMSGIRVKNVKLQKKVSQKENSRTYYAPKIKINNNKIFLSIIFHY